MFNELSHEFHDILKKEILSQKFYSYGLVNDKNKIYIILSQLNYLLMYFKDLVNLNFYEFFQFINNQIVLIQVNDQLTEKINLLCISLIETIHLLSFNQALTDGNNYYVSFRDQVFSLLIKIIKLDYSDDKIFNSTLIKLKTKSFGVILDMFVYITSEKINNNLLYYNIEENHIELYELFLKVNFFKFFNDYNLDNNHCTNIFENELELKTECYKIISEKFSRLMLLNLGIFKNVNFCCMYFESFFIIKLPIIFENINNFFVETLLEKEIVHYIKYKTTNLNILIFYITKITMRIFQNKSKIVDKMDSDMINRLWSYYLKQMKKLKSKYNKENILDKDKGFFENFIINSINVALDSKKEMIENDKTVISIENAGLLDILQVFMKYTLFLEENDFKNILMIYLKIAKDVELIENVNRIDIKTIEKFKNFLLNKSKLYMANEEDKKEINLDEEKKNESEEDEKKKIVSEDEILEKTPVKKREKKTQRSQKRKYQEQVLSNEEKFLFSSNTNKKKKKY